MVVEDGREVGQMEMLRESHECPVHWDQGLHHHRKEVDLCMINQISLT